MIILEQQLTKILKFYHPKEIISYLSIKAQDILFLTLAGLNVSLSLVKLYLFRKHQSRARQI
jgi:hypothetical protein